MGDSEDRGIGPCPFCYVADKKERARVGELDNRVAELERELGEANAALRELWELANGGDVPDECPGCSQKPGSPTLCFRCLVVRWVKGQKLVARDVAARLEKVRASTLAALATDADHSQYSARMARMLRSDLGIECPTCHDQEGGCLRCVMLGDDEAEAPPADNTEPTIDIVFDSSPGGVLGPRFVEVERNGESISIGEWVTVGDGLWALRLPDPCRASDILEKALRDRIKQLERPIDWALAELEEHRSKGFETGAYLRVLERIERLLNTEPQRKKREGDA